MHDIHAFKQTMNAIHANNQTNDKQMNGRMMRSLLLRGPEINDLTKLQVTYNSITKWLANYPNHLAYLA